jgi:hypothetical protein
LLKTPAWAWGKGRVSTLHSWGGFSELHSSAAAPLGHCTLFKPEGGSQQGQFSTTFLANPDYLEMEMWWMSIVLGPYQKIEFQIVPFYIKLPANIPKHSYRRTFACAASSAYAPHL